MTKGTKEKQNFISGRLQTGTSLPLPTTQQSILTNTRDHMQAPVCLGNVWGALQRQHLGRAPLAWAGCHSQTMTPCCCLKLTRAPSHTHTHANRRVSGSLDFPTGCLGAHGGRLYQLCTQEVWKRRRSQIICAEAMSGRK